MTGVWFSARWPIRCANCSSCAPKLNSRISNSAMSEFKVTPELLVQHNLTVGECERIQQLLGREPNLTELGIFSVMWSEHCSYKSSKVHLQRLPTEGECLVQG